MVASQTAFDFGSAVADHASPADSPAPAQAPERARSPRQPAQVQRVKRDLAANAQLEAALRGELSQPVRVTLTDNRRTMISLERRPRLLHVRLHHMFAAADPGTLRALALYLASADRGAAQHIGRYIEQHRTSIRGRSVRPVQLSSAGLHHNLHEIYQAVNAAYFESRVEAKISWSRDMPLRRRRARSIKLGSYTSRDKLIRVHPALDAEYVPRFFVEYIVYHEMLHHVLPPLRTGKKRRSLHGPEFQARERDFAEYEAALQWERDNLDRLLSRSR
jgi:predicted metal-dependent hydrolase